MNQTCCYICKLGWLPDETVPPLFNREGIYLCQNCLDVTNSRAAKKEASVEKYLNQSKGY